MNNLEEIKEAKLNVRYYGTMTVYHKVKVHNIPILSTSNNFFSIFSKPKSLKDEVTVTIKEIENFKSAIPHKKMFRSSGRTISEVEQKLANIRNKLLQQNSSYIYKIKIYDRQAKPDILGEKTPVKTIG